MHSEIDTTASQQPLRNPIPTSPTSLDDAVEYGAVVATIYEYLYGTKGEIEDDFSLREHDPLKVVKFSSYSVQSCKLGSQRFWNGSVKSIFKIIVRAEWDGESQVDKSPSVYAFSITHDATTPEFKNGKITFDISPSELKMKRDNLFIDSLSRRIRMGLALKFADG